MLIEIEIYGKLVKWSNLEKTNYILQENVKFLGWQIIYVKVIKKKLCKSTWFPHGEYKIK